VAVFVGASVLVGVDVGTGVSVGGGGLGVSVGGGRVLVGILSVDEHDEVKMKMITMQMKTIWFFMLCS
jgi:hypothetical protein